MTAKQRNIIQAGIAVFLFASMVYVWPDAETNALPVVKVKVASGCNSCHEGVGAVK